MSNQDGAAFFLNTGFKYEEWRMISMELATFFYEVVSIDGDYAHLKRTDVESSELKLVARALLPAEIVEGSKLKYEWLQYELI